MCALMASFSSAAALWRQFWLHTVPTSATATTTHTLIAVACAGQIRNAPKKKKKMLIKFYQNAVFTVDDGPPRSVEDPANQAFLQAIKERRVPDELASEFQDGLDLSIMPMPEDYDPASAPKCASA